MALPVTHFGLEQSAPPAAQWDVLISSLQNKWLLLYLLVVYMLCYGSPKSETFDQFVSE